MKECAASDPFRTRRGAREHRTWQRSGFPIDAAPQLFSRRTHLPAHNAARRLVGSVPRAHSTDAHGRQPRSDPGAAADRPGHTGARRGRVGRRRRGWGRLARVLRSAGFPAAGCGAGPGRTGCRRGVPGLPGHPETGQAARRGGQPGPLGLRQTAGRDLRAIWRERPTKSGALCRSASESANRVAERQKVRLGKRGARPP